MHSVDEAEIQNFSKDSAHWWDENGPFKPLHKLNPVRMGYIREQIIMHFDLSPHLNPPPFEWEILRPLKGLKMLDIGCGGGLVCESLTRMGAEVTGIDADGNAIDVAKAHAQKSGLNINYIKGAAEDLLSPHIPPASRGEAQSAGGEYDVVCALEIIEHVADIPSFVASVCKLCKPGGLVIFSTLNRTPKSFALGIVAAEYILRWVPQGTHNWKKFVKPSELVKHLRANGVQVMDITGLIYEPLHDRFALSKTDLDVNYFLVAHAP